MKLQPVVTFVLLLVLPLLVNGRTEAVNNRGEGFMKGKIPTVDFCEMSKNPQGYLGQTTRVTAQISPFDEGLYLLTEPAATVKCAGALGASFANKDAAQHLEIEKSMDLIRTPEYGFRALVTITGVLHKKTTGNYFSRVTKYVYEIIRFEKISPIAVHEIPTVGFCEMVKNPQLYFDKTIRLTATFTQATEAQYLNDEACPLTHDEQIGIGYTDSGEKARELNNAGIKKINSPEYGSRAIVTVIGALRNSSLHAFAWYQYRFDIIKFENVSHIIVPYNEELEAGQTYRTEAYFDKRAGLSLVKGFPLSEHHAYRIEWTNIKDFPGLRKIESKDLPKTIVFSVLSKQIIPMKVIRRWNVIYECRIIRIEES